MIFNPVSRELFTDRREYIKTLHCPKRAEWETMRPVFDAEPIRSCKHCDHPVIDTEGMTDEQLRRMIQQDPATCLKVGLDQSNVRIAPIRRDA